MSTMKLIGSIIAIVGGGYSIYFSTTSATMNTSMWLMLVLGLIVFIHGVLIMTRFASRLGRGNGVAMIIYSVLMLANQVWMETRETPIGMNGGEMAESTSWDPWMTVIAVLMLASGLIMTVRREMM